MERNVAPERLGVRVRTYVRACVCAGSESPLHRCVWLRSLRNCYVKVHAWAVGRYCNLSGVLRLPVLPAVACHSAHAIAMPPDAGRVADDARVVSGCAGPVGGPEENSDELVCCPVHREAQL